MIARARITGTGMYVPDRVVTNDELSKQMDTSDEWIRQRSGIATRHYVEPGQMPSEMAERATQQALDAAGRQASDIDCIILATLSAEADFPGTSFFLQDRLDVGNTPCFDLRAQCSGFVYSLSVADALVRAGTYRCVLVVGCELHSSGLDHTTEGRDVAVLFGDGAGAVLVEPSNDGAGLLAIRLHAEGKFADKLWVEAPAAGRSPRLTAEMIAEKRHFPKMQGRFVFKHAVTRMPEVLRETLDAAKTPLDDVDHFLFHQANLRINEHVAGTLGIPPEKCPSNIERYGNCSAASIPMLLDEGVRQGRIQSGELIAMTSFGSGFSWTSALMRW
jgi:3-oxoacyl-[acyl-carrier-protein] synthase-3